MRVQRIQKATAARFVEYLESDTIPASKPVRHHFREMTLDQSEAFVDEILADPKFAGKSVDAQLAEIMRRSAGSVNPRTVKMRLTTPASNIVRANAVAAKR
jgi:hypothetical protein